MLNGQILHAIADLWDEGEVDDAPSTYEYIMSATPCAPVHALKPERAIFRDEWSVVRDLFSSK